ncbi:hypothetical protein OIU84_005279 [Salix udensis]|uniref:Uncharacterized protein n=1 Tax=Salix udensis TaxID=889485 RepID=A0AAD6JXZ1_9ROSI|nr:hypothetical protein OIU84_005279 [Salix udensis]
MVLKEFQSLGAQRHITKISNFQEARAREECQETSTRKFTGFAAEMSLPCQQEQPIGAYNDGNEELIAVSVLDLNSNANQLDQNLRGFMLAGRPIQAWTGKIREIFSEICRSI